MRISKVVLHLKRQQSGGDDRAENGGHVAAAFESVRSAVVQQHQQQQQVFDKNQPQTVTPGLSQQQQHIWTQGFEKLLEDPLGLRAFAVSIFSFPQKVEFHRKIFDLILNKYLYVIIRAGFLEEGV